MYGIVSDSACDLTPSEVEQLQVRVVSFNVSLDNGETYLKDIKDYDIPWLYEQLRADKNRFPKTAQPSIEDFVEEYRYFAEKEMDVLCLTLSGKLTGTINSARLAAEMVMDEYPERKIRVVDSNAATVLEGEVVRQMAAYRSVCEDVDQAVKRVQEIIPTGRIFFTIENMDYLVNGGRVGKAAGLAAGMLNMRPILSLSEGELHAAGIARGRRGSIRKALSAMISYIEENHLDLENYQILTGYGSDPQEAADEVKKIRALLKENGLSYSGEIPQLQIGSLIACYTGPYPIGAGLLEKSIVHHHE